MLAGGERADDDGYLIAPDRLRGRRRRRVPLLRGGLRPGHVAVPLQRRSTRRCGARTRSSSASRRRSSRRASPPRSGSRTSRRPGSCTSTPRPPAPTCTCRSAGSRARASARTSRAARRSSSTPRPSPSTTMSDERWLVTGALGCIGAWTGHALVARGRRRRRLRPRRRRPPAAADRSPATSVDAIDLRARRHHRARRPSSASLAEHEITHVVHLAALQVPFCRENPVLGTR